MKIFGNYSRPNVFEDTVRSVWKVYLDWLWQAHSAGVGWSAAGAALLVFAH